MENLGRIGFSEEQADLLDVATKFCREKSSSEKARALLTDAHGFDQDVWAEIVQMGWLGIAIPEEYGGAGLSLAEVTPVMEQLGRAFLSSPFFASTLAMQALLVGATEEQKQKVLPQIIEGKIATCALAEAEGHWDLSKISCEVEVKGDRLHLKGAKFFVEHADVADIFIASIMHDNQPALVLIEKADIPENALRRETVIDETKRSFQLALDGISVPKTALLDKGKSAAALHHLHLAANLLAAAEMIGGTQAVIDYTIEYLQTRKQFGKLIGAYQSLKHPTVDAFIQYEQARSHLYSAAHCFNEQGTGEIATRMAKAQADAAFSYASDRSIQFHGGFGFTYDCDAQLYRRRAIWHASQFGDAAYHRKKLAELLL
ncbi:MAG: acyl-CoA dehydrogenase [Hyphococcus sp.]|nr:MAG: acyl-CoA dehydrogenase [Marinicaulis sp.]